MQVMHTTPIQAQLQTTLTTHRAYLVRWLTRLTGDPQVAEDLTQETLVEAWENRGKLTHTENIQSWINAIAYNLYKRWARRQGVEIQRYVDLHKELSATTQTEVELERSELIQLLDTALSLLPPETRALITAHYLEELPQAKLAERLGVSENAVAVRLHRGKLLLRDLLQGESNDPDDVTGSGRWQPTRMWCVSCGDAYYECKFDTVTGEYHLRCTRCNPSSKVTAWSHEEPADRDEIKGMKSYKSAINRLMVLHHKRYQPALAHGMIACTECGRPVPLSLTMPDYIGQYFSHRPGVHYICDACDRLDFTALSGIGLSTPQGRRFWKDHPRIHHLPDRLIEHEGRPAIVLTWHSKLDAHQLDVLFDQETYQLLAVFGGEA